jgi:LysM repeat protein
MGIQRGGYAASGTWASQVMAIIKTYKLYQYDNPQEPMILTQKIIPATNNNTGNQPNVYSVRKGDTLQLIAKRFQTTVEAIKQKNKLNSTTLTIGQQLYF